MYYIILEETSVAGKNRRTGQEKLRTVQSPQGLQLSLNCTGVRSQSPSALRRVSEGGEVAGQGWWQVLSWLRVAWVLVSHLERGIRAYVKWEVLPGGGRCPVWAFHVWKWSSTGARAQAAWGGNPHGGRALGGVWEQEKDVHMEGKFGTGFRLQVGWRGHSCVCAQHGKSETEWGEEGVSMLRSLVCQSLTTVKRASTGYGPVRYIKAGVEWGGQQC